MRPANGNVAGAGSGAPLAAPKQGLRGRKAARARAEALSMEQSMAGHHPLAFQAGLEAAAAAARAPAAPFRDPSTHPTTLALAAADTLSTAARLRYRAGDPPAGPGTLGGGSRLASGTELLEAAADAMAAAAAVARVAPGTPASARLVREAAAVARSAAAALPLDRGDGRGGRRAPALPDAGRMTGLQTSRLADPSGRSPSQRRHARSCQCVLCAPACCLLCVEKKAWQRELMALQMHACPPIQVVAEHGMAWS